MNTPGWISALQEALKLYHTIDDKLVRLLDDVKDLRQEFGTIRTKQMELDGRIHRLEEARSTLKAEVRAELTSLVSRLCPCRGKSSSGACTRWIVASDNK
jgi:chromosome segregation ATPase